jgi:hypothetical protein
MFQPFASYCSYSVKPVPISVDTSTGTLGGGASSPLCKLTQHTEFTFTGIDVKIYAITQWDSSGYHEHHVLNTPVYEGTASGSYTFDSTGMFVICFYNEGQGYITAREVEVTNAAVLFQTNN